MTDIINNVQEFKSCWVQKIVDLSQTKWTGPKLMQFARYRPCMVSVNDKVRFTFKKININNINQKAQYFWLFLHLTRLP